MAPLPGREASSSPRSTVGATCHGEVSRTSTASLADRDAFWRDRGGARSTGRRRSPTVLDYSKPPFANWFVGGRTNLCHNAIDRHLATRGEPEGADLHLDRDRRDEDATRSASSTPRSTASRRCSRRRASGRGDRVLIYMPMIAEAAFAMLACARIGAIHSVVFGGFAAASLATRIDDAKPKVMVTADCRHARRQGGAVQASGRRGDAAREAPAGARSSSSTAASTRDERASPAATSTTRRCARSTSDASVPCDWLESSEPSYILYTSGTTGKPKGVQRDTGGYAVALASSMRRHLLRRAGRDDVHDQRHRLGRRPFVHRLRAAHRRLDDDHVRGPADPPRSRRSGGRSSRTTR